MFNIITDVLPGEFQGCKVNTDFRQGLKFYKIVGSRELSDYERATLIVRALFTINEQLDDGSVKAVFNVPKEPEDLADFIQYYISGGETKSTGASGKKTFDFNVDAGRVYAAFWQTYGIDLRSAELHWWQFLELFKSLPEDTHLMKVIEIRNKKIPKDPESARAIRAAQRAYAIIDENARADFRSFLKG